MTAAAITMTCGSKPRSCMTPTMRMIHSGTHQQDLVLKEGVARVGPALGGTTMIGGDEMAQDMLVLHAVP
jgi:hypothetical protein